MHPLLRQTRTFTGNRFRGIKRFTAVNWPKTLYFNFKKFPFALARKLPVYFYGRVRFGNITGSIVIDAPIKRAMIGFGQPYELKQRAMGTAELVLEGKLVFRGHVQFGKDYFVYVAQAAVCEMGHMSSLGFSGKIMCFDSVILGNYARLGFESQIIDSNVHQMIDTETGAKFPMTAPIRLGNYNYLGNRISVMQRTITPDYCTVASNSICNANYSQLGNNILIGGMPAKLLKENISRDWAGEEASLQRWLIV
jgi:hypothetical protein